MPSYSRGIWWRRLVARRLVVLPVLLLVAVVVGTRLAGAVPAPVVSRLVGTGFVVPGAPPVLPWPAIGQAALDVPSAGVMMESPGRETPVPVASLAKIMTAYVVLHDHPLSAYQAGPKLTMNPLDVADAAKDERYDETSVPVTAGEVLSERQLLDGLLVHSANNLADTLARWDAGSVPGFVAKMNATARAMGLTQTHYADASGFDPATRSTAGDQLRLAQAAMRLPAFASIVDQPVITLPGAGALANYVQAVGRHGVVGVKSGFTAAAGGCVVLAARRPVGRREVLVMAAVTGQEGYAVLARADRIALGLIDAAAGRLRSVRVLSEGEPVEALQLPWRPESPVPVVTMSDIGVVGWPGTVVRVAIATKRPLGLLGAHSIIGTATIVAGDRRLACHLELLYGLRGPPLGWRLLHD